MASGPFPGAGLALLAALAPRAGAQVQQAWSNTYSGLQPRAVALHPIGGVVVAGQQGPAPSDGFVVRIDGLGIQSWVQLYDTGLGIGETLVAVAVDAQGNTYAAGASFGVSGPGLVADAQIVKIDASGAIAWSRTWAGAAGGIDAALALALDPQGNAYVTGTTKLAGPAEQYALFVARYDPSGNLAWDAQWDLDPALRERGTAIAVDDFGNVFVAGEARGSATTSDAAVLGIDSSGTIAWARTLDGGGPGAEPGLAIALGPSGRVYVGGCQGSYGTPGASDPALACYDTAGNALWVRVPGGDSMHVVRVAVDPRGDVVVLEHGSGVTGSELGLRKYDASGTELWSRTRALAGAADLRLDFAGEAYVFGASYAAPGADPDGLVQRWDAAGNLRWSHVYGGVGTPEAAVGGAVGQFGRTYASGPATGTLTVRCDELALEYCLGDGSGTACPCANESATSDRSGCEHSLGSAGALTSGGAPSLAGDTLVLRGSRMPDSTALYFQGTAVTSNGLGSPFGDGLRCAGGTVTRFGTKTNSGGASEYPGVGDASISVRGVVTAPGSRTYQIWYRNAAVYCTPATFNLSNGLRVTWVP